ncbi:GGDEF domain-containing protein [Shewanella marisflavi]|uniref:diguanylate cyclase DgcS n=1 Tax=Shewanella TaxID=22 RepID=UPI003AB0587B
MDFALATEFSFDEYRYQPDHHHNSASVPNLVSVMQQLHESLDPRTVFACYGKLMGQYLPVQGVSLVYKEYQLSWGTEQGLLIKQNLSHDGLNAMITYRLSAPLVKPQTELLYQLQSLLLSPLVNAIAYQQMAKQAMHDSLTQLGNRRYYEQSLKQVMARALRHDDAITLVVLDLDNFKSLNDKYGHLVGDEVLCQFGKTLNQAIRDSDQAFRIGGDEFTLIVEGDAAAASILCERILALMAQDNLLNKFQVQCSLGVAQWHGDKDAEALYLRADRALYHAKAAGRRCYRIDQAS